MDDINVEEDTTKNQEVKENNVDESVSEESESSETEIRESLVMAKQRLEGKLDPYVPGDPFDDYLEQVDNYFELNKLDDDERKVRLLINLIGPVASGKVIKSFKPDKYNTKTYKEVIDQCKKLFIGERNPIVEHFKFNERNQKEGETIDDFAIELQSLADTCVFDNFLDTALRDRFISGLRDMEIKKELLGLDGSSSFKLAVEKAKKEELIKREAKAMVVESSATIVETNVNKVEESFRRNPKYHQDAQSWRSRSRSRSPGSYRHRSSSTENVTCFKCQGKGHIAAFCANSRTVTPFYRTARAGVNRFGKRNYANSSNANSVNDCTDDFENLSCNDFENDDSDTNALNSIILGNSINSISGNRKALVRLPVGSVELSMEVDTGSCVAVCDQYTYEKFFNQQKLVSCTLPLSVVSGDKLKVLGSVIVRVKVKAGNFSLPLVVVETRKPFTPLLGRNWLNILLPSWQSRFKINSIDSPKEIDLVRNRVVNKLKSKFPRVFDDDLTKPILGFTVDIRINESFKPFVHKAYTVPFNLRERVGKQLDQLEQADIIEKIEYATCASPMVVVAKANKDIRICFDGSVTINPFIETHHYPLPVIDELLANKSRANLFCVLDLKGAYQQLIVNNKTKSLLAVNTIKGLYAFKRLPFGVKPAASIFQSVIDKIIGGIENAQAYIDDILIWGSTAQELHAHVEKVLERLSHYNVKLNYAKCQWFINKVTYLGHVISARGIEPNLEKVKAIVEAPAPKNVSQLKALLGMVQYYSKFLPKLNVTFAPLYKLLKKDSPWEWDEDCQNAFESCKKALSSHRLLVHFDPSLPLIITCDASNEGIAGVLSHRVNGEEKPVMYVSRALKPAERNYPILHREALAIVFTLEKLYKYVYGHYVEIFTDHKPLEGIFMGKKGAPSVVASRLQRYVWRISHFDYVVKYKKGVENGNADCLSRLPIQAKLSMEDENEMLCNQIASDSVNSKPFVSMNEIREETSNDECLSLIRDYVTNGWFCDRDKKRFKGFYTNRRLLDVSSGCLTYNERLVIPFSLKKTVLKILHANHAGIVRMKQMARLRVFWEGLNSDIERFVRECEPCQLLMKDNADKEYGKWAVTTYPFERIHLDFFYFQGNTFLILVDAFSRWMDVKRMTRTNAEKLIQTLMEVFVLFGYPRELVTDNGPPFGSFEFQKFCDSHHIKKTLTPPYHPASNGLAERAVQTTKSVLRKFVIDNANSFNLDRSIEKFLFNYRNSPHTEDSIVPSHRILNFKPRSPLSVLTELPNDNPKVTFNEIPSTNLIRNDELKISPKKVFVPRENVLYISKLQGYATSIRARILKKNSDTVYTIAIGNSIRSAHINQLRKSILKNFIVPKITPAPSTSDQASSSTKNSDNGNDHHDMKESPTNDLPVALRKATRKKKKIIRLAPTFTRRK